MPELADVLVPPNAEGTRATVLRWCKAVGDAVAQDEPLLELETDKVTVEVAAPVSGILIEILKQVNAEVNPDEVLARLSLAADAAATPNSGTAAEPATAQSTTSTMPTMPEMLAPPALPAPPAPPAPLEPPALSAAAASPQPLSPAVRRLLREHSLAAADIIGTGRDGRITAQDVTRRAAGAPGTKAATAAGVGLVTHTAVRRRVAEHMVRSLTQAPHVTILFEADLTRVLAHRSHHAADYEARGARLTLTAYFISACVRALRAHPEVNATFLPDALELHAPVNIGVGTALGNKGLIVPVIHGAQELDLFHVALELGRLVAAARAGKLAPQDVRGGTFTISNHGVGGSLLAAPIVINQPQVAILGVGKVERRVCVLEVDGAEAIGVRSMCYLTLTIDHRALDAFQANAFLSSVVGTLQQWPLGEPDQS
jgi:2-oxoglutarate dehydrogenase E2 component (dihydrolipoamide succinyltransferase)